MWQFQLNSIENLTSLADTLGISIDASPDISCLAEPLHVAGLDIPNSLAVHPMEGCDGDSDGRPQALTFRRYERFASGGAGLIWAEAIAVAPEGRANPRQLWLHRCTADSFAALIRRARHAAEAHDPAHNPVIVAQLTHSGRYSKPRGLSEPLIPQHDPYRDPLSPQQTPDPRTPPKLPADWPVITDDYLDNLQDAYVEAARIAFDVGFDAVDIKSCHGYLINELFACRRRPGKYGGSFANRTRFLLEVIDKIRAELGPDKPVFARLGVYDAVPYPYGWAVDRDDYTKPDLTEPKQLISLLHDRGVRAINITIANPYYNPHIGRPFNEPIAGGYDSPEHPLKGVTRLIDLTAQLQQAFPQIAFVGTGYSWLRTLMPNVAAAAKALHKASIIGAGRLAFAYPDFAHDIITKSKLAPDKVCVACSACTQIMRDGGRTGCVVRDNKVYGPIFKKGRMSNRRILSDFASDCLQCQEPTCQLACPAGVNIPAFIRHFLDGDDRTAYDTIRQSNMLPEVCAWLCPVEQQCQGGCLRGYIGDGPLPIAEIQRYLAEQANRNGWSKLRIPDKPTGGNIAVVGAGPAGLAAAAVLLELGHTVTIYDKSANIGGIVASIIPEDRQGSSLNSELHAIFDNVPPDRMITKLGTQLNADFNLDNLMARSFDAVFIGAGLSESVATISEKLEGLYSATDFLAAARSRTLPPLAGKSVAVIGGGNTAVDAAVTARQNDAQDVYLIYRRSFQQMPAWTAERNAALDNGIHLLVLTQVLGIKSSDGRVTAVTLCPTKLAEPDPSGRRRPVNIESSAYDLDMDIVIEAIGQKAQTGLECILPGVDIKDGLVRLRCGSFSTSRSGVFAGGDIARGPATVVAAVADGMNAAKEIDLFLKQKTRSSK